MNEQRELLDAPLRVPERQLNAGPDYSAASSLDFHINQFLLIVAGLIALGAFFEPGGAMFILLLWNLVVGGYQLLSALIGAIRGNRLKLYYFVAAIAYLIVLCTVVTVFDPHINGQNEMVLATIFLIVLPLSGAFYFTLLCREAKYRS
mgnify:CR=1 FL=1